LRCGRGDFEVEVEREVERKKITCSFFLLRLSVSFRPLCPLLRHSTTSLQPLLPFPLPQLPLYLSRSRSRAPPLQKVKMPGESALPFVLISVMVAGMGSLQQGVHKLFNGKPKPVGVDAFDRAAAARDKRIRECAAKVRLVDEWKKKKSGGGKKVDRSVFSFFSFFFQPRPRETPSHLRSFFLLRNKSLFHSIENTPSSSSSPRADRPNS